MAKNKQLTRQKIIESAEQEFLNKGYENASMQSIAMGAGISAPALYRHFISKEELFGYLVAPITDYFKERHTESSEELDELLKEMKPSDLWEYAQNKSGEMYEWIYNNYEEFRLILTCASGTKYENFMKKYVDDDVSMTYGLLEKMKEYGNVSELPLKSDLHLLMSAYNAMFMEFVTMNYSRDEAKRAGVLITDFFYAGWNKVFSLEK